MTKVSAATNGNRTIAPLSEYVAPADAAIVTDRVHDVVDKIFQRDASARAAVARNLAGRSTAAKEFRTRAQQAFAEFRPTKHPSGIGARPNYVQPGESVTPMQHEVLQKGLEAFRASTVPRSLKLTKSAELDKLIQKPAANRSDAIVGTIPLEDLMSYIQNKSETGSFIARGSSLTVPNAEVEADRRIDRILHSTDKPAPSVHSNGARASAAYAATAEPSSAQFVQDSVDLQMRTATSPETELRYLPRGNQIEEVHKNITFELRDGPSDVTSFHDFHSLQIAFEDVWTELFDSQVADLGKQLYEEYVRLKFASGVDDQADRSVNTIDDLRQLMDEIRDFSRLTVASIPPALQGPPDTNGRPTTDNTSNVIEKVVEAVLNPVGAIIDLLSDAFRGEAELTWDSFKKPLPLGDEIDVTTDPLPQGLDKRETVVQIVLTQSASVSGYKRLALVDKYGSKTYIDTSDQQKSNSIYVRTDILKERVLEFGKWTGVEVHGVYMLGGLEAIKTSTRVTFTWKKDH